jgi:hypothetical protein
MRLTRAQEDVVTQTLAQPGVSVFDLLHRVKREGHTYKDSREAILTLLEKRVILLERSSHKAYFNRNQGKVYRGIV